MKKINAWQNWYLASVAFTLAILLAIQLYHARARNHASDSAEHAALSDMLIRQWYDVFGSVPMPRFDIFAKAIKGYAWLKNNGQLANDSLLTLIDFRLSANQKRLWVMDLKNRRILFHTLVAHGRNSGEEYAEKFSNKPQSYQSSLGFYITGEIYNGKHGISLYLDGVEKGFNDNARSRAIVMHGADYVSEAFIRENGRLGRSHGCPAIPRDVEEKIITKIANGSCLFIYGDHSSYDIVSELINVPPDLLALHF